MVETQDKRTVISVGSIPELVSLREEILESLGYEVCSTTIPQEADPSQTTQLRCSVDLLFIVG
jgi:hypothetical protein